MSTLLDERKASVLKEIIHQYIRIAQPVGSRTVSVQTGIEVSSATVRHEMAELEERGYLYQPHTSAGRIPTELAFRYYVDHLLDSEALPDLDLEKVRSLFKMEDFTPEGLIKETPRVLSEVSHQTAMVLSPRIEHLVLRGVYLAHTSGKKILARFMFKGGTMEQRLISDDAGLSLADLNRISNLLNKIADGKTMLQIRQYLLDSMEEEKNLYDRLRLMALNLSEQIIQQQEGELYIEGQANILDQPEFFRAELLKRLFRTLEEKKLIIRLLDRAMLSPGIRVIIGEEHDLEAMKECSLITKTYGKGPTVIGSIAVLGPIRMDYPKVISLVNYISELISENLDN